MTLIPTSIQTMALPLLVGLPEPDPAAQAAADSAKLALQRAAQELATNPDQFFMEFGHEAIRFGLKVVAALLIYIVGAWLIRLVKKWMNRIFARKGTEKTLVTFSTSLVSIILTILLVVVAISTLGVNTTSLAALLAAGGMAIGMALSGTVQNFAGGIMILAFKPFKAGDYIKAQGFEGIVEEVNMVSTRLKTLDNNTIVLPNGALSNGTIDNFSQRPVHREVWNIAISYGTDFEKAKSVILGILAAEPRILDSSTKDIPDPTVNLLELADSSVNLTVRAWVNTPDYWPVRFKILEEIYTKLPRNGVSFPFPQMDVHIKKD